MITIPCRLAGHWTSVARTVIQYVPTGIWLIGAIVVVGGCRSSLTPLSGLRQQPDFDRLLELERAGDDPTPTSESTTSAPAKSSSKTQVAQRRPGQAAQRRISDQDQISDHDQQDSELIDDEEDSPIAHQQLLQRTQFALQRSSEQPPAPVQSAHASESKPDTRSTADNRQPSEVSRPARQQASSTTPVVQTASFNQPPAAVVEAAVIEAATVNAAETTAEAVPASAIKESRYTSDDSPVSPSASAELDWEQHLRLAIEQLNRSGDDSLSARPQERNRRAIISRLLALALGDREQMLRKIDSLQPGEQDYFNYQLSALFDAADPEGNPVSSRRWSLVMLNQRKAHDYLTALSNLEVNNVTFCTEVESFGVTTRFPNYHFTADQEVLLYCELDNFACEKNASGQGFETQLQGSYEIVDASGKRVADQLLPLDTHVCRNRRRDYFIAYRIYMPPNIDAGDYTLKLTVEDLKGRKFGQADIKFKIQ
ncbi:MAG: hypothetical protein KF752_18635 [Pirellulaceae bacterium]|nr:hypothetical protein [Pirellulaceae bacterium]